MMDVINEEEISLEDGILHHQENVDLLPANIELSALEVTMGNVMSREMIMKEYIDAIRCRYDYILIDCMPSLGNQMYYPQKDSKHVICSCFDAYSGIDKVWNIHDVDPEGKGEVNLEINFDKECFMYYQAFVSYVDSLNQVYQCESVKNQKYYCWVYEDEKYCILEEIYNSMKSGQFNEQNRYRNFNNYVNEKLSDIEYPEQFSHDGISSYEDGIVVCSSVSWRDKLH